MRILPLWPLLLLTQLVTTTASFAQKKSSGSYPGLFCPGSKTIINQPYIPFSVKSGDKLADNKTVANKVVLINFWFESCIPCMAEMEALNTVYTKLKDDPGFVFISLSWDKPEAIQRVKEKYSLQFDVFTASVEECQRLNFGCGYPTSIILDKSGLVKFWHSGGSKDKEKAGKMVLSTLVPEINGLL